MNKIKVESLVRAIKKRKRKHLAALTKVEQPTLDLLYRVRAKRAKARAERVKAVPDLAKAERLEGEAADLEVEREVMLPMIWSKCDAIEDAIDMCREFVALLNCDGQEGEMWTCVPTGCGYAIEPWLAAVASNNDINVCAWASRDRALASKVSATLAQRRCKVVEVTLAVGLITSRIDATYNNGDPEHCFEGLADLPAFDPAGWEAKDGDGNHVYPVHMIQNDDYRLYARAKRMAQHSNATMRHDEKDIYFVDEVDVKAWAVYTPPVKGDQ